MKITHIVLLAVVAGLAFLVLSNEYDFPDWGVLTSVAVQPHNVVVEEEGQRVSISIIIDSVEDLYAWQIAISWSGSATFSDVELPANGVFSGQRVYGPMEMNIEAIPNLPENSVILACSLLGDETTFSGSGALAEAEFILTNAGTTVEFSIIEEHSMLVDSEGHTISFNKPVPLG